MFYPQIGIRKIACALLSSKQLVGRSSSLYGSCFICSNNERPMNRTTRALKYDLCDHSSLSSKVIVVHGAISQLTAVCAPKPEETHFSVTD